MPRINSPLCEFPQVIDCEVTQPIVGEGFSQNFTQMPFELQVEYTVLDSTSLQGAPILSVGEEMKLRAAAE